MDKYMRINISVILLVLLLNVYFCNGNHTVLCIESERRALLQFKQDLLDPSNRLSSWSADAADCCQWLGVLCNNLTAHINNLNLRNPRPPFPEPSWRSDEEAYERSMLSGNINPSLLSLKDLRFLDLSNNHFEGIEIPAFLSSMRSLRYLNLSQALGFGFKGRIPHQLGNLTNLQYLSVQGFDLYAENLQWLSNLSLLQHLDLSHVNLTIASDWLQVINALPSLIELHLSNCDFQHIPVLPVANFSSLSVLDLSENQFVNSPILIRLVSSLTNIVVSLDLSGCSIEGPIPDNLQNMTSLKFLNLNYNKFNSSIPEWLYTLSRIEYLDLDSNELQGKISNVIGNLTSLKFLNLKFNFFNSSIPESLYTLSRIEYLDLGYNKLQGKISNAIGNLTSLKFLNLNYYIFNSSIPESLYTLSRIEYLYLCSNELQGKISDAIGNLTSLVSLDLSYNELEVEQGFLSSLENLCNLKSMDLSGVKLKVEISEVLESLSSGCLSSNDLEFLHLHNCQLYGHLTDQIRQFKNLAFLDLGRNSISGSIPESLGELSSLRQLYIFNNHKINGTLPRGLGQLKNLEMLFIFNTSLEGIVSEVHFANLTRLKTISASECSLSLNVSIDWVPSFQLQALNMRSWHLGPGFPLWLRRQKYLVYLDISDAKISDIIPSWFSNFAPYLSNANLSHNQIRGRIPDLSIFGNGVTIDMSSNNLNGPLGHVSSNVSGLDLSNNSLSGSISHFLCYKLNVPQRMRILNLGRNNFSGTIPNCWGKWQNLEAIRLDNNNLSGNIPSSMASLISLQSLHLRNNRFSGEFPQSLRNCTMLKKVDIGENELVGHIPTWIGEALPNLKIFSLPSNKLGGHIPDGLCALSSLHILDLAHNNFSGSIPRCLGNFSAMETKNNSEEPMFHFRNGGTFYEIALLVMKDRVFEYTTTLQFVKSMDLSNNSLSGEIPEEVSCLQELQSLNFSHNMLSGRIPKNIGSMKSLESLDFSINQLSGEIPSSISSLNFLNHLNLSDNNLIGKIPTGTQLQSLDASSFIGNELCGPPLTQNCSASNAMSPTILENGNEKKGREHEVNWFYVSMALGFVVGFWSVLCPLFLNRTWRFRYYQYMDNIGYKLYDFIVECKYWRS